MIDYKINIGDLNKRIIIQVLTTGTNENGFPVESWETYSTVWSSINNLSSREYYAAVAVQAENTVKFIIRYLKDLDIVYSTDGKDITKIYRIKFNNSIFNITGIDNIKFGNKFMELKAVSEVA